MPQCLLFHGLNNDRSVVAVFQAQSSVFSMNPPRVVLPPAKAKARPPARVVPPPLAKAKAGPSAYGALNPVFVPSLKRRPRPSVAPELLTKDVKDSWDWNSWNSPETWIQDKRAQENEYEEIGQTTKDAKDSWDWNSWNSTETWIPDKRAQDDESEYEEIVEEVADSHEQLIFESQQNLQRHRGKVPVDRSGKRKISPDLQEKPYSPRKKNRRGSWKHARARNAKLDDKRRELSRVEVRELRYSQLSCKETFQCGRSISQLVQHLFEDSPFEVIQVYKLRRLVSCVQTTYNPSINYLQVCEVLYVWITHL